MARGVPPRPAAGAGRQQPARQQQRSQPAQQRRAAVEQHRVADQQRRTAEQQRRGVRPARHTAPLATQHRLRQQQFLREAHGTRQEAEAAGRTEEIRQRVAGLETILATGLQRSARIDLAGLIRTPPPEEEFDPGPLAGPEPEPRREDFAPAGPPARWGGPARRERQAAAAREAYQQARDRWERAEQERTAQLAAARQRHEQRLAQARADADAYNSRIARVAAGLQDRDPVVVESFLRTVLRRVPLPAEFPRRAEVTHHPDRELVTVRMLLPGSDIVPAVSGYEYAEPADEIRPVPRPGEESDDLYYQVIAQVALLAVRDVLEAEPALAGVRFHGLVDDRDPDTGEPALPCLLSFRAGRDEFAELDLVELSPEECLERLDAWVSPDPSAHRPIPAAASAEPAP